ncbi:MAPEG family protein [Novosphingopyxis sp.]|uniref:MAPEG family protein n=1 Tax=Novosphingopyxis sp. TaxID=2709690 RepID=UPI003B5CF4D2
MTLPVTALTAIICAIMLLATAAATVRGRFRTKTAFGTEGDALLTAHSRAHGNLAEHAPIVILMIGLLELSDANHWALTGLAVIFLGARAAHIVGLHQKHEGGPPKLRAIGVIGTWAVMAALIVWILYKVITVNG